MRDLAVLVPGKDDEAAIAGILARHESLGIRTVTFTTFVHPDRDPGCRLRPEAILASQSRTHRHALVVFDRDVTPDESADLESEVEGRLRRHGWDSDRCRCVVIDPELETWVWPVSARVADALGWKGGPEELKQWLLSTEVTLHGLRREFLREGDVKPFGPKEAMNEALRVARKPRSSSIFRILAASVSLRRCQDPAFRRLVTTLQRWFPVEPPGTSGRQ